MCHCEHPTSPQVSCIGQGPGTGYCAGLECTIISITNLQCTNLVHGTPLQIKSLSAVTLI